MGAVERNFGLMVALQHLADAAGSLHSLRIEKTNPTEYRTLIKSLLKGITSHKQQEL